MDQCSLDQPMKLYNQLITINSRTDRRLPPTKQHGEMVAESASKVEEQIRKLQRIEEGDLVTMNKLLTDSQLPVIFVPPRKPVATAS